MPRISVSPPKYRKHKASGQAVVTIQGRDHYLGPHGTKASKIEYDRLVGEWLAAGRPAVSVSPQTEITVSEIILGFWKHAQAFYVKNGRSTGTAENLKPILSYLKQTYGSQPAVEFGPLALKAIQSKLVAAGKSRRYVNDSMHRIRQMFRWAASEQLISPLIPQALAMVSGLRKGHSAAHDPPPIMPVDDATVDATLPHLPPVVADMVRLQRLTGARSGEIIQMRPCDVDRNGDVWRFIPREHKTEHHGRQRVICIGPKAQAVLQPYLSREAEAYCFSPVESDRQRRKRLHDARKTPLSCGNTPGSNRKRRPKREPGDCYTNNSYRRAIDRACELAFKMPKELRSFPPSLGAEEIKRRRRLAKEWRAKHCWSPHQLRHSAATEIRHKFGLEAAQVTLGHSRADVTQIYAEKNHALAAQVAREVG